MKKILFNNQYGLTKAVLEGRKTMTRRSVPEKLFRAIEGGAPGFAVMESKYKVGEVVAVAQPYEAFMGHEELCERGLLTSAAAHNSMFVKANLMPHHIRITNVRVEKLQDISEEDCLREGIAKDTSTLYFNGYAYDYSFDQDENMLATRWYESPRAAFAALIDKVSGKGTWESNPWVFVYEFELL